MNHPCILSIALIMSVTPLSALAASNAKAESTVRKYFAQTPEMIAIAKCESGFRQFDDSGSVLRGGSGGKMIGIFQFHEDYHRSAAQLLGLNIDTLLGNIAYARTLYKSEGATPWNSSRYCWGDTQEARSPNSETITMALAYGDTHPEVRILQRKLNALGYPPALSGPGSKGNETDYFGSFTRLALRRYQCKENIACRGDAEYGALGTATRAALNEAAR